MSIEHHNNTSGASVNTKSSESCHDYHFRIVSLFQDIAPQSEVLESLRLIAFSVVTLRKRTISRKYISKVLGICLKTVSNHNMFIEENGILKIERRFKQANVYKHEYIMALAEFFGFVKPIISRTCSLTNYLFGKSSMITKISMLIEFGKECFSDFSRQETENHSETLRKAKMWDEIVGSSPTTSHQYSV